MKAYVITIKNVDLSEMAAKTCIHSSKRVKNPFDIEVFDAVIPPAVGVEMEKYDLTWNYPWDGEVRDIKSGMRKRAYQTRDPLARMACALSHYKLWLKSIETNEPILVLEHDSRFLHRLDPQPILESKFNIVGVNDPIGATRLARKFSEKVKSYNKDIVPIPTIDNFDVPQGLAGNSAYIIKPAGAKAVVQAVKEYGLWPNDAIMCKQLIKKMGVTQQYYTVVQGLPSTTTD
jgi:GR25 family glycosyltransferase involved in LPS biosynthesis